MKDKKGYFEIVDRDHPLGKVWFYMDEDEERLVSPKRTAEIVFRISAWAEGRYEENIPWDNFLIPENQLRDRLYDMQSLSSGHANHYSHPVDYALFLLLGLFTLAFDTKYFDIDLDKNKDNPDTVEYILCNTPEYKALMASEYVKDGRISGELLLRLGRDCGFFRTDSKFSLSKRSNTIRKQVLIDKILDEILTLHPKMKKNHVAEDIKKELKKTHGILMGEANIERNYLKNFKERKAKFQKKR